MLTGKVKQISTISTSRTEFNIYGRERRKILEGITLQVNCIIGSSGSGNDDDSDGCYDDFKEGNTTLLTNDFSFKVLQVKSQEKTVKSVLPLKSQYHRATE